MIQPTPETDRQKGLVAAQMGDLEQAAEHYRRALKLRPQAAGWFAEASQVASRRGRFAEARKLIETAISLAPGDNTYTCLNADLYQAEGDYPACVAALRAALNQDPHETRAYSRLVFLHCAGLAVLEKRDLAVLDGLLANAHLLPLSRRIHLHFALADLRDQKGDYPAAFEHFRQANACKLKNRPAADRFRPALYRRLWKELSALFTPAFVAARSDFGLSDESPIFIVGMPRTGSTLLCEQLSRHRAVANGGELRHIHVICTERLPRTTGVPFPACLRAADNLQIKAEAEFYCRRLKQYSVAAHHNRATIVNKMLTDFLHLGAIYLMFPKARILYTTRHPLATIWSCYSRNIAAYFSNDLGDLTEMSLICRAFVDFWRQRLPLPIMTVSYEDLVTDCAGTVAKAAAFLGLEWHLDDLKISQTPKPDTTLSAVQVRRPIYRDRLEHWRHYADFLAPFSQRLAPLIDSQ